MSARPTVLHVTWQRHGGRAAEISAALGGEPLHVHPATRGSRRRAALTRYALSTATTAWALARRRPRAVVVTNPPLVPGLLAAAWSALARRPFVLDSHTSSFGVKGNEVARRLLPLHRWLARRAAGVMVTTDEWVEVVGSWGGRGVIVHEAPPTRAALPSRADAPPGARVRAVFVCVFSDDEPVEAVVEAAALLPEVDVAVTGDPARCPEGLRERATSNVDFVGFLGGDAYAELLAGCDVVIALTTEPTSIMRAAYEAVYASRSLVVSDWPALRQTFPGAAFSDNTARSLADAVVEASQRTDAERDEALVLQQQRWEEQVGRLRALLDLPAAAGVRDGAGGGR
ncbi:glycosyltransferase [uncultured Pseudokineococcus sp.]|uniref:glycosyltransferase n=1 Tax=uncultured Pseudokineococcus sp. TaxID=1642928 RepID=UPI0026276EC5|nr:glycosyltransferase [uncultured Pseudokineococcus sp.]